MPAEQLETTAAAIQNGRTNPYVGPRALRYGEHIYGRDRESLDLRDLLIAERIVLLYSPLARGKLRSFKRASFLRWKRRSLKCDLSSALVRNRVLREIVTSRAQSFRSRKIAPRTASIRLKLRWCFVCRTFGKDERSVAQRLDSADLRPVRGNSHDRSTRSRSENRILQPNRRSFARSATVGALRHTRRLRRGLDPYLRALPTRLKSTFRLDLLTTDCARNEFNNRRVNSGVSSRKKRPRAW